MRREESQTERKKIRKSDRKSVLGSIRVNLGNKKLKICLYLNFCIERNGKRLNVKAEEKYKVWFLLPGTHLFSFPLGMTESRSALFLSLQT